MPVNGGAGRDRTDDLLLAKQALSQLSYGPALKFFCECILSRLKESFGRDAQTANNFKNVSAAFLILQRIKKYNVK